MRLQLALKYRIRPGEEFQFLDEDERQEFNKLVVEALEKAPEASRDEQVVIAREVRKTYLEETMPPATVPVRISGFLLREAVALRYKQQGQQGQAPVVQIPRKAEGKTKPGKWWGEIVEMFDGTPESLELEPAVANWLVKTVWEDDKVQNGFPPAVQHWINVFDEEMTRLSDEIGGEKKKPAAIAEKAGE